MTNLLREPERAWCAQEKNMDAMAVLGFLFIFLVFWLIGKILVALAHTWVGDLLLGKKTHAKRALKDDWYTDPANPWLFDDWK